jgi:hypothetical protein
MPLPEKCSGIFVFADAENSFVKKIIFPDEYFFTDFINDAQDHFQLQLTRCCRACTIHSPVGRIAGDRSRPRKNSRRLKFIL